MFASEIRQWLWVELTNHNILNINELENPPIRLAFTIYHIMKYITNRPRRTADDLRITQAARATMAAINNDHSADGENVDPEGDGG